MLSLCMNTGKVCFCCLSDFDLSLSLLRKNHYWKLLCKWLFSSWLTVLSSREGKHICTLCYIKYICVCILISLYPFCLDDDYSDTYNATYAVINNGERCFTYNESDSSMCNLFPTHLSLPVRSASSPLPRICPLSCPQQMTIVCHPAPPWPIPLPAHTRTGHSPKAPQTTGGILGPGSLHHLLYPLHPHPCHRFSSWGPERVTERKTCLICKRSFVLFLSFITHS